jgi:hypothetical protein
MAALVKAARASYAGTDMAHAAADSGASSAGSTRWKAAAEVGLVFLVFFIHGAWPVPEVNEPHYLGKAKHYWDAAWCARDFFLNTADAHEVFYFAFGWLTRWLPLPVVAWCGRIVTWGLLAWAWRRLSAALVDGWLYCVLSAALFVALNDRFHMAGEWVVGGVEAKGFAYVFVLLGLESLVRDRWGRALVLFGAASAFHVVVGGWSVLAAGVVWLAADRRPPLEKLILPAAAGLLLALGGLVPAVALSWGVDPRVVNEANRLYVYERLGHHLLPQQMPLEFIVRHLLLVASLVPLVRLAPNGEGFRRLRAFVAAAVGMAAIGMVLSMLAWPNADLAAAVLRFYWFRMSDVMVPLGVALLASAILCRWQSERHPWFALVLSAAMLAAGCHLGQTIWMRQVYTTPRAFWPISAQADFDDWRAICKWAAEETPPDALFLVPRLSHSFRWRSGRAEVVTRKDLPQDAPGIVEWWRRLTRIYGPDDTQPVWRDGPAQLSAERLHELGELYGVDYIVTSARRPLALGRAGPITRTLAVYELPRRGVAGSSQPPSSPRDTPNEDQP